VIDEFANVILNDNGKEIERAIIKLAQMGRACGIHLVIATQRPVVKVVSGLIKANFPSRIAFPVVSRVDSRVILDRGGAEKLANPGDMLFLYGRHLVKAKGCYVTETEVDGYVAAIRKRRRK
jgi:S-DNA-T family DNA segregation ATPase FtsK/SpoIIIE